MGQFRITIKDLLRNGSSIAIHCFCLQKTVWTQKRLSRFSPALGLWKATETLRCAMCGRLGQVRHVDILDHDLGLRNETVESPDRIRKVILLKSAPARGKRNEQCKSSILKRPAGPPQIPVRA